MTRRRQRGVTLVELLVVLTILAFVATLAVLNGPPPRSTAREEAERFAARLAAAWQDAVMDGAAASVAVTPRGYRIERFSRGEWKLDPSLRRFSERSVKENVSLSIVLSDEAAANKMRRGEADDPQAEKRIVLDPIGVTTPFTVEFADRRERWRVWKTEDESFAVERIRR